MKKIIPLLFLIHTLYGATVCENQLFSLSAYKQKEKSGIEVSSVLKELSATCKLSVIFNDDVSKKMLHKKLDYINISNYTFVQFLDFLFNEANLFYSYDSERNIINVQYLKTKTFNVDYIYLSELTSESSKSISTGATGGSDATGNQGGSGGYSGGYSGGGAAGSSGNNGGSSSSTDYTVIHSKSKFTFWKNLHNNILKLFHKKDNIRIFINKDVSLLTVTTTKKNLQKIERYLNILLKKMHKQVAIEAKLVELTYDDSSSTGIDWSKLDLSLSGSAKAVGGTLISKPSYNLTYGFSTSKFLKYLKTYGDIKVLSNPKVVTMNNQPAVINVGEQLSYKFQTGSVTTTGGTAAGTNTFSVGSTFVGVTLYVIPEVSKNNEIIMKINPVVSKLSDDSTTSGTTANVTRELPPDTKIKQMTSIVRIKNDEKIVIGGLVSVTRGGTSVKVPLLGDVPVLGSLFNYKEKVKKKTEMFIIIQPHVVTKKSMPTMKDIDFDDPFFKSTFDKNVTNK